MNQTTVPPPVLINVAADLELPENVLGALVVKGTMYAALHNLVSPLAPKKKRIRIKGNSVLTATGMEGVHMLVSSGYSVWWDAKFNDIKETMRLNARMLAAAGVDAATVMCTASLEALRAFKAAAGIMKVFGVTVLTDISEEECLEMFGRDRKEAVKYLALRAKRAGLDGIVCSSQELRYLGAVPELNRFPRITPAIRPLWYQKKDEQVTAETPTYAVQWGVNELVIGRPITASKPNSDGKPQSPSEAVEWIECEVNEALHAQS